DVQKDTLQVYCEIFIDLEGLDLLDMESPIDCVCLFIVFHPHIKKIPSRNPHALNLHKIRTTENKTPLAIHELRLEMAINRGYWTGDPGDDLATASHPSYGEDENAPLPPSDELANDPEAPN
ncbi:hypothetical protein B0H13DRAFT_1573542, partial [Mycena leptocephala]